jgi:hypothetical protein
MQKLLDIKEFPAAVEAFYRKNAGTVLDKKYFHREADKNSKWIYEESDLPWLMLDLKAPVEEMYKEALQFANDTVVQDYPGLNFTESAKKDPSQRGWNTVCIHGLSKHQFDRASVYGYEHEDLAPYVWTEIADACPVTKKFLESLPYERLYRARFTILAPGGYADYSKKISFALNHPKGFSFTMDNHGAIPWEEGRGFLLNVDENYHSVINRSDIPRIHLITMGKPDWNKMDELLKKSYYNLNPELNMSSSIDDL